MGRPVGVCADVGSTFTKVALVDLESGALLATAEERTTVDTDVLDGLDAAIAAVQRRLPPDCDVTTYDVCSSAGGGLRLAVIGYEPLVTAEAGHRVGLSAGARVVHVAAGRLDAAAVAELRAVAPDVILLVGGTDGGDAEVLRHNAGRLAAARVTASVRGPHATTRTGRVRSAVVVAGNREVAGEAVAALTARGVPVVGADNVLPRIGALNPGPARAAIREVFLRHVIGGTGLSRGPRFASLVRGATPDIVLTAVETLADHLGGDLVVVDIGGATTDVYSVLSPDPDAGAGADRGVVGTLWRSRTVEGDLGLRWSAPGVVAAARAEALLTPAEADQLDRAAGRRADNPAFVPHTADEQAVDARLAQLAATVALRRHARGDPLRTTVTARTAAPPTGGLGSSDRAGRKDLRRVRLIIGSGGVLRYAASAQTGAEVLSAVLTDHAGGWALPRAARVIIDTHYLLAPAGLLARTHPTAALALLRTLATPAATSA